MINRVHIKYDYSYKLKYEFDQLFIINLSVII